MKYTTFITNNSEVVLITRQERIIRNAWMTRAAGLPKTIHGHLVTMRGKWTITPGICNYCQGPTRNGVCKSCGHSVVCAWCKKTKQTDGSWRKVFSLKSSTKSHGACPDCVDKYIKTYGPLPSRN